MNIEFKFKPGREYPWSWYYSPQGAEFGSVMDWLYHTYGPPVKGDRWDMHGGWIYFRDKKDAEWFQLRWS
jgi:hypothetical protein